MRTARFRRAKSAQPADCGNLSNVVDQLGNLVLRRDTGVRDFSELLAPERSHGDPARRLIQSGIQYSASGDARTFFRDLLDVHDSVPAPEWTHVLADIVECVFVFLVHRKYSGITSTTVYRECLVNINVGPGEVGLAGQSLDVVAWSDAEFCGELLEAKKQITTNVSANFAKKVRRMLAVSAHLEAHCENRSLVAIASIAGRQEAREFIVTTLSLPEDSIPLALITLETVSDWAGERHIPT